MNESDLQKISVEINRLEWDEHATVHYDLMSDALVWSDERPRNLCGSEMWCMRPIFRYRTGLILGLEIAEFRDYWEAGRRLFPQWIGFRRDRSSRDPALEEEYHRLSDSGGQIL
jgi:hypothetical protein